MSQKKDLVMVPFKDITMTNIIKLAKGLFMEAAVETATITALRRTVLLTAKINQ